MNRNTTLAGIILSSLITFNAFAYDVYTGCEVPATSFKRTLYIDPVRGSDLGSGAATSPFKTLTKALYDRKILSGDHVVLLPGEHGVAKVNKYRNPELVNIPSWIWIDSKDGAKLSGLDLRDINRWLITNHEVSGPGPDLIYLSGANQVVVTNGTMWGGNHSSVSAWMNAPNALMSRNSKCVSVGHNWIGNVRFGITINNDGLAPSANFAKALIANNTIQGFSGDGIRVNGSSITATSNTIVDNYITEAQGDLNHDDGIQGFAAAGVVYDNVRLEYNFIAHTTDPKRLFQGDLQGIGIFDGTYSNLVIRYNQIISNVYHGIGILGGKTVIIERNTVLGTNPAKITKIGIYPYKGGALPVGGVIRNNVSSFIYKHTAVSYTNNFATSTPANDFVLFDLVNAKFDLHPRSTAPFYNKGAGAL